MALLCPALLCNYFWCENEQKDSKNRQQKLLSSVSLKDFSENYKQSKIALIISLWNPIFNHYISYAIFYYL